MMEPLEEVLFHDDFDRGMQGWTLLTGNYEGSLDTLLPQQRDFRPPMLSNLTMWDTGSAGSLHGTYAMKLATRARTGSCAVALKRMTYRKAQPIRIEAWFAAKPEATELRLGNRELRSFGIFLDLQDDEHRVMPHVRYRNTTGRWQFKCDAPPVTAISGSTRTHFHLGDDGWRDLADGEQELCYNELPTKQNWHYLRLDFDLATMRFLELRCNDRRWPGESLRPMTMDAWPNLRGMLNVGFWVDTTTERRSFLYLDSAVLSTGANA